GAHEEQHAGPRVQPPANLQAAEEPGQPAEDWRPDRQAREERDEEEQRDQPVDQARREPMADDLVADDHVLVPPRAEDAGVHGGAHGSFVSFGPTAKKCPIAPTTAPSTATKPSGRSTDFQKRTTRGTCGSRGSPYHSGWSPYAITVTTAVPPTPG